MFKNYFKSALRNLLHNKAFSLINIAGLTIGVAAFLVIALYVVRELSYDRYHVNAKRIFRIVENLKTENEMLFQSTSSPPMGPTFLAEFPEVKNYVRFQDWNGVVRKGNISFFEEHVCLADSSVFSIFTFPVLKGNPHTALTKPYSVALTETMAKKYFGSEDPVGKTLFFDGKTYDVTAVIADVPENSHFTFTMLVSFATFVAQRPDVSKNDWWYANGFHTYLLLAEGDHQLENLRKKESAYIEKYIGKQAREYKMFYDDLPLQPLASIYLEAPRSWENGKRGSSSNIYILSIVAVFILVIACFNYVNLATARVSRRLKEVGLRKVFGAERSALIQQFMGEALVVSTISTLLGCIAAYAVLPLFRNALDATLSFDQLPTLYFISGIGLLGIGLGFLSGAYPALIISGLHPLLIFRNSPRSLFSRNLLRKFLVAGQFAISIILLAGTMLVFDQLNFLRNKELGFTKNATLVIRFHWDGQVIRHMAAIKTELRSVAGVTGVTASDKVPGESTGNNYTKIENAEGKITETNINTMGIDEDFIPNYNITLLAGRNFSKDFPADDSTAYILNEAASKDLGYKTPQDALGKKIVGWRTGMIIGVVQDFHYRSLHRAVEPLLINTNHEWRNKFSVKITSDNIPAVVAAIGKKWDHLVPDLPFMYSFLDDDYNRLYKSEEQLGKVVSVFSGLAIFVACLGLFGLTSFAVERRFKEIGIRKALGASVSSIVKLISTEFFRLVAIAVLVAVPVTYWMVGKWLQNFTDRISIGVSVFIISGLSVLAIAWLSVSALSVRAARTNPVDSLRNE